MTVLMLAPRTVVATKGLCMSNEIKGGMITRYSHTVFSYSAQECQIEGRYNSRLVMD
jgi:hypothetical protein